MPAAFQFQINPPQPPVKHDCYNDSLWRTPYAIFDVQGGQIGDRRYANADLAAADVEKLIAANQRDGYHLKWATGKQFFIKDLRFPNNGVTVAIGKMI